MKKRARTGEDKSSQEFTNVLDINKNLLYTRDGLIIAFVKILPISIGLLSDNEKNSFIEQLTAELSVEKEPFHFLAISRPVDVQPLIEQNMELRRATTNLIRKELLQKEMENISDFSFSEEVVERQFYFYITIKNEGNSEGEIKKRIQNFAEHFESVGVKTEILKDNEIIKLCNLVNNPAIVMIEDNDYTPTIPILKETMYGSEK